VVVLTVLLRFKQLAFCFSRGSRTSNEHLLITLYTMTVRNICSARGLKCLLCRCTNATFIHFSCSFTDSSLGSWHPHS